MKKELTKNSKPTSKSKNKKSNENIIILRISKH